MNVYYDQLAQLIIKNPSLPLLNGEVCFYEGNAKSYQKVTRLVQEKGKTKTSFFITPWISGIKRKKEPGAIRQETETEYYKGKLYVTNMRVVFNCQVDAFNLMIPSITQISQFKDGMRVISGGRSFDVMTSDIKKILNIIDLMNKAQTEPQTAQATQKAQTQTTTRTTKREPKEFSFLSQGKGAGHHTYALALTICGAVTVRGSHRLFSHSISSNSSSTVRSVMAGVLLPTTCSASSHLLSCICRIFSSMVLRAISRTTCTAFFCPIRWARSVA